MNMRMSFQLPLALVLFAAACGQGGESSLHQGQGLLPPDPNAPACTSGKDCPAGQGCGDDNKCHRDGECHGDSDCASGQICYEGLTGSGLGFCASQRPSHDPYCRSDGMGACRSKCTTSEECGAYNTCVGGYCHWGDECKTAADCGPNHLCTPRLDDPEYGFNECIPDPNPTCVTDPAGTCRFPCKTDPDCTQGGGCASDGLCHASNECKVNADCPSGQICHADAHFGGLCGPARN